MLCSCASDVGMVWRPRLLWRPQPAAAGRGEAHGALVVIKRLAHAARNLRVSRGGPEGDTWHSIMHRPCRWRRDVGRRAEGDRRQSDRVLGFIQRNLKQEYKEWGIYLIKWFIRCAGYRRLLWAPGKGVQAHGRKLGAQSSWSGQGHKTNGRSSDRDVCLHVP